jgi:PAS domain S-box-containing protein
MSETNLPDEPTPILPEPARELRPPEREKINVLLVDDQPSRLLSYEAILRELGHNLITANSGVEALRRLMQQEFAVILLDVSMPGMDGFETAAMIHQHPRFERTPIIFVTALHVTDMDRLKGYQLGAVDYVYVPVVPEILRSKVAVLVELYRKRLELQRLNDTLAEANEQLALANSTLQAEKTRELERLNATLEAANMELAEANQTLSAEMAERARAEEARRKGDERLRAIVQHTPAAVYQIDLDNRFVLVNRRFEELYGRQATDVVGRTIREVFSPEAAAAVEANIARVISENRALEVEAIVDTPDGPHVYSKIKAPMLDDEGKLRGVVVVATDITDRKRMLEALREGDRRKDEFLAMLAHELRNPLAPILNAAQLMRLKEIEDPELLWCRDVIERQGQHLARLVDDLLDVSRITQGKIKLKREHVDLATIVARAVETTRPLIDARRHELVLEMPCDPIYVDADLTRLAQVIGNLLNNAAKYTEDGGLIRLTVQQGTGLDGHGEAVVRVRDSGVGIPPEMLPRMFELFSQAERTLDRAQGGLGIGLALVRRLVEMHGGIVSAHSEGAHKGSEFVVRLPSLDVHEAPAPKPSSLNGVVRPQARRVVIADDNQDAANSLAMLLRASGDTVELAHDGAEALEVAERVRPDVIFLDIGMPRLDGCATARRIRATSWGRDVALIALTGWGEPDARGRTHEAGFDAHLVKPIDFGALMGVLTKLRIEGSGRNRPAEAVGLS